MATVDAMRGVRADLGIGAAGSSRSIATWASRSRRWASGSTGSASKVIITGAVGHAAGGAVQLSRPALPARGVRQRPAACAAAAGDHRRRRAAPHPRAGRPVRRRVQQRHAGRAGRAVRELPADLRAVRPGPGWRPAVHHAAGVLRADPRRGRPPRRRPRRGRRPDAGDGRHRHPRRRPRPPGRTARGRADTVLLPPVRRHGPETTFRLLGREVLPQVTNI